MSENILFSAINYSSNHAPNPHEWLPGIAEDWKWSSQSHLPECVVFCFKNVCDVTKVIIPSVSTDVTTDQFRVALFLRKMDGSLYRIDELRDQNVGRDESQMSQNIVTSPHVYLANNMGNPWVIDLDKPLTAQALVIMIEGYGWFSLNGKPKVQGLLDYDKKVTPSVFHGGITVLYTS